MANICENQLVLKGPIEELKRFRELFKKYNYTFTYNAIIEMPESLSIPSGSIRKSAIILALYTKAKNDINNLNIVDFKKLDTTNEFKLLTTHKKFRKDAINRLNLLYNDCKTQIEYYPISGIKCKKCPMSDEPIRTREELLKYGQTLIYNKVTYGYYDWYEWSNKHWGVKWDAGEADEVNIHGTYISIYFTSPWGPPMGVLEDISRKFPKLKLIVNVDCEGTGIWEIVGKGGILKEQNFKQFSDEDFD